MTRAGNSMPFVTNSLFAARAAPLTGTPRTHLSSGAGWYRCTARSIPMLLILLGCERSPRAAANYGPEDEQQKPGLVARTLYRKTAGRRTCGDRSVPMCVMGCP
jgi:hypothetical protein